MKKSQNLEISMIEHIINIIDEIKKNKGEFSIYGAGEIGQKILDLLKIFSLKPKFIFDRNSKKKEIDGIEILKPSEILTRKIGLILITSIEFDQEIKDFLSEINFPGTVLSTKAENFNSNSFSNKNEFLEEYRKISIKTREVSAKYTPFERKKIDQKKISSVKYIAFYLPQFHNIEENNLWWGKNFTEWNNVTRAIPQYIGHYQPHLPVDIGFYDLSRKETIKDQIAIAKNYGIYGFCVYFYWFNGRRILEKPLDIILNNPDLDMPFCLFWANESWTRTWQGFSESDKSESRMLIEQKHNDADDILLMEYLCSKVFSDKRYIKVNNKPLFIIYHPELFDDIEKTTLIWRKIAKRHGYPDIFLLFIKKTQHDDIVKLNKNFDSALQFLPNDSYNQRKEVNLLNFDFKGKTYCYEAMVNNEKSRSFEYKIIRNAFMSWDNEARRPTKGISYVGSSPSLFKDYIKYLNDFSKSNKVENESFIFINAWNEWAEGAHLEPDREYGYTWLNILSEIIENN